MSCPKCSKEIIDEDSTICPNCGVSLTSDVDEIQNTIEIQTKNTDLVLVASIFTIIAAAFAASLGVIGVYQYTAYIDYYGFEVVGGFLIWAIIGFSVSTLAITGGIFMLKRKYFKISMMGVAFLLVSVVINYVILQHYAYGFSDSIMMAETAVVILSVLSGLFVASSKTEFA